MLGTPLLRSIFSSNIPLRLQASRILTNCENYKNGILYLRFHTVATCKRTFQRPRWANDMVHRFTLPKFKLIGRMPLRRAHIREYVVDTDVKKNVLLFEYVNQKSINSLTWVGLVQLIIWGTVSAFAYTPEFSTSWGKDVTSFRLLLFVSGLLIGPATCGCAWLLRSRCIKYLILHKGGKKMTLVTYNPVQRSTTLQVPVEDVTCNSSLKDLKSFVPIKVKGTFLYYLLDTKGKFHNVKLFNHTIGVNREWR